MSVLDVRMSTLGMVQEFLQRSIVPMFIAIYSRRSNKTSGIERHEMFCKNNCRGRVLCHVDQIYFGPHNVHLRVFAKCGDGIVEPWKKSMKPSAWGHRTVQCQTMQEYHRSYHLSEV